MSRVITFSTKFPKGHPREGQPTYFVEKIYNSIYGNDWGDAPGDLTSYVTDVDSDILDLKHHTIRKGKRWKVGDKFSPRIWSGKPYASKMITIAPDIEIKKAWDVDIESDGVWWGFRVNGDLLGIDDEISVALNDGLEHTDLLHWFGINGIKTIPDFSGQIICWNESIEY